jgi:nucleotide-binding universal stress UspA family protein
MKKVLIALDYDPSAEKIAETGFALAKSMGAEVALLHVTGDNMYYSSAAYSPIMGFGGFTGLAALQSDMSEDLKRISQDFLNKTKEHLGDTGIITLVKEGDSAESILEAAKDLPADIIVMGSHSRNWIETIAMGSVTKKVLHNTSTPLFIIPTKKSE